MQTVGGGHVAISPTLASCLYNHRSCCVVMSQYLGVMAGGSNSLFNSLTRPLVFVADPGDDRIELSFRNTAGFSSRIILTGMASFSSAYSSRACTVETIVSVNFAPCKGIAGTVRRLVIQFEPQKISEESRGQ